MVTRSGISSSLSASEAVAAASERAERRMRGRTRRREARGSGSGPPLPNYGEALAATAADLISSSAAYDDRATASVGDVEWSCQCNARGPFPIEDHSSRSTLPSIPSSERTAKGRGGEQPIHASHLLRYFLARSVGRSMDIGEPTATDQSPDGRGQARGG